MKNAYRKVVDFAGSKKFFYLIVGLLVFEGCWMALSSHYPMAFDESFHFGLIKLYAHNLNPWRAGQPPGADIFGAAYRDPSYIYHWLMSFPYRLISLFVHDENKLIILLRLMNVGIFAGGLFVARRLLLKATKSTILVNLSLLFLVLTPVIPSLVGQINYDNLLFGAVALALLLTITFVEQLRAQKQFNLKHLAYLMIICLLSSLIKYAFLPIFLVVGFYTIFHLSRTYRMPNRNLNKELWAAHHKLSNLAKISLLIGLVIGCGLFLERYAVNTITYHTPLPECDQVLNIERCQAYGPWRRNHRITLSRGQPGSGTVHYTTATFTRHWLFVQYRTMFYVLNGPDSSYTIGQPLLFPEAVAVTIFIAGLGCLIFYAKRIFKGQRPRILLAYVVTIYALVLWLQNYADYLHLGQPVALQGRYLIPILAPLYLLLLIGIATATRHYEKLQVILASIAIILFLQGGGIVTFLVRSNDTWYITNSVTSRINKSVQPAVKWLVIGD